MLPIGPLPAFVLVHREHPRRQLIPNKGNPSGQILEERGQCFERGISRERLRHLGLVGRDRFLVSLGRAIA